MDYIIYSLYKQSPLSREGGQNSSFDKPLELILSVEKPRDSIKNDQPHQTHNHTRDGIYHRPLGSGLSVLISRRDQIQNSGNDKADDGNEAENREQLEHYILNDAENGG